MPQIIKTNNILDFAKDYLQSELCPIPTAPREKRPALDWKQYQTRRPTEQELEALFANAGDGCGIGLVCGAVSGNLEVLDFDDHGSAFEDWKAKIPLELYSCLTVEQSPSGGFHVYYRCEEIGQNNKLAMTLDGKVLIETRGEGGFIVCEPTKGYSRIQGVFFSIPELTTGERQTLIDAAKGLDKAPPPTPPKPKPKPDRREVAEESLAEAYNKSGDVRKLLEKHGWQLDHTGADSIEYWTRPGKDKGTSATIKEINGVPILYNFSSNAGIIAEKGLSPFRLYAELEHGGDMSEATRDLKRQGYGSASVNATDASSNTSTANPDLDGTFSIHRDPETYTAFPLHCLPPMTRKWVEEESRAMNVDPSYLAMSILTLVSAIIGAKYELDLGGGWRTNDTIWTFLIGNSSAKKSPCISLCLSLIIDKERELRQENMKAQDDYELALSDYQTKLKAFSRRKSTDEKEELPKKPTRPPEKVLAVTGDFTMNGLIKAAADNPEGFLIAADEVSTILNAQNTTKKGEPMLGELSKFYKGDSSKTQFKHNDNNVYAARCLAAILTAGTPGNVRNLIAGTENASNGFTSRMLMIYPPMPEQFCFEQVNEQTIVNVKSVLEYLIDLRPASMDGINREEITYEGSRPHTIRLDESGGVVSRWCNWREDIFNKTKQSNDELEASLLGKSEELLPRLALLLHIIKAAERCIAEGKPKSAINNTQRFIPGTYIAVEIPLQTWIEAEQLTNWLIDESRAVHQILGLSTTQNSNKDVAKAIDKLVAGMMKKGISEIPSSRIGDYVSQARGKDAKAKDLVKRIIAAASKDKRLSIRQGKYNDRVVQYLQLDKSQT